MLCKPFGNFAAARFGSLVCAMVFVWAYSAELVRAQDNRNVEQVLKDSLDSVGPNYHGEHQYFNDHSSWLLVGMILVVLGCISARFVYRVKVRVAKLRAAASANTSATPPDPSAGSR
jgi:hypothetical protein